MSLIYFDAECIIAQRLGLCNTIEMTLGRVLWVDLGMLFDSGDHREERSLKLRKCQKKSYNPTCCDAAAR